MNMKKTAFALAVFLTLALPLAADAQIDLNSIIASLKAQVAALQAQIQNLISGSPAPSAVTQQFNVSLYNGLSHPQVRQLQQFLAQDSSLYPEGLVTGYFGLLTEAAVRRFQARYNIPAVGLVGPQTRAKLNELAGTNTAVITDISRTVIDEPETVIVESAQELIEPVEEFLDSEDYNLSSRPSYDISQIERLIQDEINDERLEVNSPRLAWNSSLSNLARLHAGDHVSENLEITNPNLACSYPILHHSGFTFGKSVADRADNLGIDYLRIGENLALFRASENLIYRYKVSEGPVNCPEIESVDPFVSSKSEVDRAISERKRVLAGIREVEWVNREWLSERQIAQKALDLWLDSPPHRKNMLNPEFTEGGVGIAVVNDHLVVAHVLRKP